MSNHVEVIDVSKIDSIELSELTTEIFSDGQLKIKPFAFYGNFTRYAIRYFMHLNGIYVLPTKELIDFLSSNIIGNAIEIGAGNGAIGRALEIPITDSRLQERPDISKTYKGLGQPIIKYPDDVLKFEAIDAVKAFKPQTVIGAYITSLLKAEDEVGSEYGVDEEAMTENIMRYIMIGNRITHGYKSILKKPHLEFMFPELITRSVNQLKNFICIFDKHKI